MAAPRINRVTGLVERAAPRRPLAVRDAAGMTPAEVHAALSAGIQLRMTAAQYVAVVESAALEPKERRDITAARRKNDIRLVGS